MQKKKSRLSPRRRGARREDGTGVKNVTFKNCRRSRWRVTERSTIHTCLSIPANNSRSKAPVSTRWSLLIKGALITRLRDLIPGEGEEKRVSRGPGKAPWSHLAVCLQKPSKCLPMQRQRLERTNIWVPPHSGDVTADGRKRNARVNVSPACVCEVVQKDAENDERYQERENDRDIKTQPALCCIRTPGV